MTYSIIISVYLVLDFVNPSSQAMPYTIHSNIGNLESNTLAAPSFEVLRWCVASFGDGVEPRWKPKRVDVQIGHLRFIHKTIYRLQMCLLLTQ